MIKIIITLLIFISISSNSYANDKYACIQYQNKDLSWNRPYKLPIKIVNGSHLNHTEKSYEYKSYSTYVIAQWPNKRYSILQANFNYLPYFYNEITDQNHHTARIKKVSLHGGCN